MKIYINNEPVQFSLENENELSQIVEQTSQWLSQEGFLLAGLTLNGKTLDAEKRSEWDHTPVDEIDELHFIAILPVEIYKAELTECFDTLLRFNREIEQDGPSQELEQQFTRQVALLPQLLSGQMTLSDTGIRDRLSNLYKKYKENPEEKNPLIQFIQGTLVLLQERISESDHPVGEMEKTLTFLEKNLPVMTDVPVLLQTGKDKDAMNAVIQFSELIQKLIRIHILLKQLKVVSFENDQQAADFGTMFQELNNTLSEMIDAMNNNDSVLIGDLAEYEIVPKTEKLISFTRNGLKTATAGSQE